jgi:hypothetical protein
VHLERAANAAKTGICAFDYSVPQLALPMDWIRSIVHDHSEREGVVVQCSVLDVKGRTASNVQCPLDNACVFGPIEGAGASRKSGSSLDALIPFSNLLRYSLGPRNWGPGGGDFQF